MKLRYAVVGSILLLLGVASVAAVIGLYSQMSAKVSASDYQAGLSHIPSDYTFVFGANVQKFVHSPAYSKFQQNSPVGGDLARFVEKTGLDPMRDIYYLVGAGNGKQFTGPGKGVVIVSGSFKNDAIKSYIRSKSAPVEKTYGGASIMMIPDPKGDTMQNGVAFLSDQEIALGDLDSLKSVLDINGQEGKSILYSGMIAPLIKEIGTEEMFWFAGDASGLVSRAPSSSPFAGQLMASSSSIKSIVGTMDLSDALTAKISATAFNVEQAAKLVEAFRGLVAFGQLAGNSNPDFKALLSGFKISQVSEQVKVELSVPADLLSKMSQSSKLTH